MNKGDNDTLDCAFSESESVAKTHRHALLVLHSVARKRSHQRADGANVALVDQFLRPRGTRGAQQLSALQPVLQVGLDRAVAAAQAARIGKLARIFSNGTQRVTESPRSPGEKGWSSSSGSFGTVERWASDTPFFFIEITGMEMQDAHRSCCRNPGASTRMRSRCVR